jgi:hypothetical protein
VSAPSETSIRKRSNCNIVARIRQSIATGSRERGICQGERRHAPWKSVSCLFANDVQATQSRSCPLWVKSRHRAVKSPCPLYPQKRTSLSVTGMSALCQKRTSRAKMPTQFSQCCLLFRVYGGAVFCIEGRLEMGRIQLASCRRLAMRSPSPRLRAISTATARIRCAMAGRPCISGSVTWSSK